MLSGARCDGVGPLDSGRDVGRLRRFRLRRLAFRPDYHLVKKEVKQKEIIKINIYLRGSLNSTSILKSGS